MKDALEKSGLAVPETPAAPKQDPKKWANELPEERAPYVPFEAPALTKPKGSSSNVPKGKVRREPDEPKE
jgi:hypothetical protein